MNFPNEEKMFEFYQEKIDACAAVAFDNVKLINMPPDYLTNVEGLSLYFDAGLFMLGLKVGIVEKDLWFNWALTVVLAAKVSQKLRKTMMWTAKQKQDAKTFFRMFLRNYGDERSLVTQMRFNEIIGYASCTPAEVKRILNNKNLEISKEDKSNAVEQNRADEA